jgi:hypothetical protein
MSARRLELCLSLLLAGSRAAGWLKALTTIRGFNAVETVAALSMISLKMMDTLFVVISCLRAFLNVAKST